jgi:hypothetical protein
MLVLDNGDLQQFEVRKITSLIQRETRGVRTWGRGTLTVPQQLDVLEKVPDGVQE